MGSGISNNRRVVILTPSFSANTVGVQHNILALLRQKRSHSFESSDCRSFKYLPDDFSLCPRYLGFAGSVTAHSFIFSEASRRLCAAAIIWARMRRPESITSCCSELKSSLLTKCPVPFLNLKPVSCHKDHQGSNLALL